MKKIFFLFCCLFMAANALMAQRRQSEPHDSSYYRRQADSVVRNAPLILKVRHLKGNTLRGRNDEIIAKGQYLVIDVIKGNLRSGDTVEIELNMGKAYWNENGTYDFPMHSTYDGPSGGGGSDDFYLFCNKLDISQKRYYSNSKGIISYYSTPASSIALASVIEEANPDIKDVMSFNHLWFGREHDFLNYVNKILLSVQEIKPISTPKKKGKTKGKRRLGYTIPTINRQSTVETLYVGVSDSTSNLANYNYFQKND